ncbi:MAG: flagellar basal body P-ring formation chaperone FlgA [Bacillota bacterium]
MRAKLLMAIVLILLVVSTIPTLAQQNTITIANQVQVRTLDVKLGEIANIEGDQQFVAQAASLNLGRTPYPGYQRVIYRDDVVHALRQQGVNLNKIRFRVPYQFTVKANYKQLGVEKLVEAGKDYIVEQLNYQAEKLEIEALNPPEKVVVPQGEISFDVAGNNARRLLGVNMLPIKIMVNGEQYRKHYIKFRAELWKEVLTSKKKLKRGQKLSADLFVKKEKLITNSKKDYVTSKEEVENKILKQSLAANRALTSNLLDTTALVDRWQEVELIAKIGGIVVSTTGKALEEGGKGDIIKVKNISSGKKIKAEVIGSKQVQGIIN